MFEKLRKYSSKNLTDFRREIAVGQSVNAVATAIIVLVASVVFFISGFGGKYLDPAALRFSIMLYAPLMLLGLVTLSATLLLRRNAQKNWRALEFFTLLVLGALPFWTATAVYCAIDGSKSVNILLWAVSLAAAGSVVCVPPIYSVGLFITASAYMLILCHGTLEIGEYVNGTILVFVCAWSSVLRFMKEYGQYKLMKEKEAYLARISHEIRTPINAVLGMNELIGRESSDAKILGYSKDINSAGTMLLSLVNDILDMSKLESGRMAIVPEEYSLSAMLHDLDNLIRFRATSSGLEFNINADESLPERLLGDEIRIRQVVTNILTNAVKYTDRGSVMLDVSGEVKDDTVLLVFKVTDTGIGIREEDIAKLQQSFYRIEGKRNHRVEGTGLGLNIVMLLLEAMNGTMTVKSEYGRGSEFTVSIPQKIVANLPISAQNSNDGSSPEHKNVPGFVAPDAHILVVDDNDINRKVFTALLKYTLIQVTEASSGREMIELVKKEHFDIIFLDHVMPEMDGCEALAQMRKDIPESREIPIVALTANQSDSSYEFYTGRGFTDYMSKPIGVKKLEGIIAKYLPDTMLKKP